MSVAIQSMPVQPSAGTRRAAAALPLLGGVVGVALLAVCLIRPDLANGWGLDRLPDTVVTAIYAASALFMLVGGVMALRQAGIGGAITLGGALLWGIGCIWLKSFGLLLGLPLALAFLGGLVGTIGHDRSASEADSRLVYRQNTLTRLTHWVWAAAMFFLLASGLQIFNARPNLYIGQQSGFGFENSILDIYAVNGPNGPAGQTKFLGQVFDTTGVLGMSGTAQQPVFTAFPAWATIPSYRDLGTGRVVHFFFAWVLVGTLAVWLINGLASGHFWRDIVLKPRDLRLLPRDIWDHLRLKLVHSRSYSPLQKLAYFAVLVVLLPLIILTGLTMSPGMDAAWPWLLDLFGGRQTARTIHFCAMLGLVLFFIVHIAMVLLAGPINELRSMITGYYRVSAEHDEEKGQ